MVYEYHDLIPAAHLSVRALFIAYVPMYLLASRYVQPGLELKSCTIALMNRCPNTINSVAW